MNNNILSNSAKRLLARKKRANKIFIFLLMILLLWFPSHLINQYSFGFVGAESGSLATQAQGFLSGWLEKMFGKEEETSLAKEKEVLLQENAALKETIRQKNIQFQDSNLSSAYNIKELKVIGKDNFLNTPLLFLFGGNDVQLKKGMPVLDQQGALLGTIKESQEKISQVILTPNHDSRVGAKIAGSDWDGILEGNRDLRAVLEMLPLDSQPKVGDQVITDNRNPDVPAGILLGTVSMVRESDDHLFKEAVLDLPWDSGKLDKVWVVVGRK